MPYHFRPFHFISQVTLDLLKVGAEVLTSSYDVDSLVQSSSCGWVVNDTGGDGAFFLEVPLSAELLMWDREEPCLIQKSAVLVTEMDGPAYRGRQVGFWY